MPRRGRATLVLLLITVLLPLAFVGLGLWERQRGSSDHETLEMQRNRIAKVVTVLEARPVPDGKLDTGAQLRRNGQTYIGPLARSQAREALDEAESALAVSRVRQYLPPVVIVCGALVAGLSVLALLTATLLGRAGRNSREALLHGFGFVRLSLPPLLGLLVLLAAIGLVSVVAFEAAAILEAEDLSSADIKLVLLAAVLIGASLWTAGKAVLQLRRTAGIFTPDPLLIRGRTVSRDEAPGLWRLLDDLAARLGALRPDDVVVGLTGGVFVSSGPKVLDPGGASLAGRTLYLPLPLLPLLREDEVATIIGHELAHFSGGDTEYSLRFLPIYAGVGRSLDAVLMATTARDGSVSLLARPALPLGIFVMDQFHLAVRHWSRLREFAADTEGAKVTSTGAAARALLRVTAVQPRIGETLETAYRTPDAARPDLVAATLQHVAGRGLESPASHLEERQPHPTDTHPTTRQRLEALGCEPTLELLAEAAAPPPPEALSRLSAYFANPGALCRIASEDLLTAARQDARAAHEALETAAAGVDAEEVTLHENSRIGGLFLLGVGGILGAMVLAVIVLSPSQRTEDWIVIAGGGAMGLIFAVFGAVMLRRGNRPFLTLRPDAMAIAGLDRPISWEHVAAVDMIVDRGRVATTVHLLPEAPFPARVRRGRYVKLDPKRRIVTFSAGPPRELKAQGFADLVARYRRAAAARRLLAEKASISQEGLTGA